MFEKLIKCKDVTFHKVNNSTKKSKCNTNNKDKIN